jgi:hypothetical protein
LREFKRIQRPGGLLVISEHPLDFDIAESSQLDARTSNRKPARILQQWAKRGMT